MVLFSGLSQLRLSHLLLVPWYQYSLSASSAYYLSTISTTSSEMMVIGHFELGQLLT